MAGAQSDPSDAYVGPQPEVLSNSAEQLTPAAPAVEAATPASAVKSSSLAFTGGDAATLALLGGGAVAVGGILVATRRRSATTA